MTNLTDQKMYRVLAERERVLIQERELNAALAGLKKQREPLDAQLREYMDGRETTDLSKWTLKWVDRRAYEVPECSYVTVKVNTRKLVAVKTMKAVA